METLTIYHGASVPIRAKGEHQCRLSRFAHERRGWHTFKQDQTTRRAVDALRKRDCLEVSGDQFRFKYPKG